MTKQTEKYSIIHHFEFRPCLHYSSISKKNYISCNEIWIEVPIYITELDMIEIIEPPDDYNEMLYIFLAD